MGTMLLDNVINTLTKWFLKSCIFSPTFSAQEKIFKKHLSSAGVTVKCVFEVLKVTWKRH